MPLKDSTRPTSQAFIQQKELRQRLGNVSAMWLFRHRDKLPAPIVISGRRFWLEAEVDAYIERLWTQRNAEKAQSAGAEP
jgi:predicted DNA-binding transcriptional regulator AlpA